MQLFVYALHHAKLGQVLGVKHVCFPVQVNDVQLYGKSRREVVSFLKEVPPPFTLVCCRHPINDLEPGSESEPEPEPVLRVEPKPGPARQLQCGVEEVRTGDIHDL